MSVLRVAAKMCATLVAAGALALGPASAGAALTERVSVSGAGGQADGHSGRSRVTAGGRLVLFESGSSNLVENEANTVPSIYLRDREAGLTRRVVADAYNPFVTSDGRYLAFTSDAPGHVPGDTNGLFDAFVLDRETAATTRVSVGSGGAQADAVSTSGGISADGGVAVFESLASNLVPGDTNGLHDVFAHDLRTDTTERISVDAQGRQANGPSTGPVVSANGRFVAFASASTNLAGPAPSPGIYVRDRLLGTTELVSVDSAGRPANSSSTAAAISADGRVVAFVSYASNLAPGDTNGKPDVFVRDRASRITEAISVSATGATGNLNSEPPVDVSADGRFVTFSSAATNLVPGDTNGTFDVFVHDRASGATERASVDSAGGQADSFSGFFANYLPAISPDGRFVTFASDASDLVPGDTNGTIDVFLRDRGPAGTPGDRIRALKQVIAGFGLPHGTANSLTTKLDAALAALEGGRPPSDACGPLRAFLNHVRAQSGEKLSVAQADRLTAEAVEIRTALGCR